MHTRNPTPTPLTAAAALTLMTACATRGAVMADGADRQLVRRDGAVNLDAIYELRTDDTS